MSYLSFCFFLSSLKQVEHYYCTTTVVLRSYSSSLILNLISSSSVQRKSRGKGQNLLIQCAVCGGCLLFAVFAVIYYRLVHLFVLGLKTKNRASPKLPILSLSLPLNRYYFILQYLMSREVRPDGKKEEKAGKKSNCRWRPPTEIVAVVVAVAEVSVWHVVALSLGTQMANTEN